MKKMAILLTTLSVLLFGCGTAISKNSSDLMKVINKSDNAPIVIDDINHQANNRREVITDFSLDLFRESFDDKNILMSPLSIVSALAMVTNGASNNTLTEIEKALGSDINSLNEYLYAYKSYLPTDKQYKVSLANSIWFKDKESLSVNIDFLQTNKDYYDASIYKAAFDNSTKDDINYWINDKTNGMIEKILEEAPSDNVVMYLINALSFDAEWQHIYQKEQISDGEFTLEDGSQKTIQFMHSAEHTYLENDDAFGFIKPYKDNKYAFVALLPKDNITMSQFLSKLDASTLEFLIKYQRSEKVIASLPKFKVEYNTLLNDSLQSLGIKDAFDGDNADFSKMAKSLDGNIFISRVLHKTIIEVDEKGTKAGAVTTVKMDTTSANIDPKVVNLNRPFFYMIIDTQQNLPIFMGSLMNKK